MILGQGQQALTSIRIAVLTGLLPQPPPSFLQCGGSMQFYVWKWVVARVNIDTGLLRGKGDTGTKWE